MAGKLKAKDQGQEYQADKAAAEWVAPSTLVPWKANPRKITKEAVDAVAKSIQRYGFSAPIVARRENKELIAGHTRLRAALQLKLNVVPVRFLDISEADAHKLALADNKLGELTSWDDSLDEILAGLKDDPDVFDLGWSESELDKLFGSLAGEDKKPQVEYTNKVVAPIYRPTKSSVPAISDLYDSNKLVSLLKAIDEADVQQDVKVFLRLAAHRHVVFDYEEIAEFYAHATPEIQDLMEDSALVIIDYGKAIEQGFVKMSQDIAASYEDDARENEDA